MSNWMMFLSRNRRLSVVPEQSEENIKWHNFWIRLSSDRDKKWGRRKRRVYLEVDDKAEKLEI